MTENFVNRKKDFDYLMRSIHTMSDANRIVLIKGKSGIGKSAFTKKVLAEQFYRESVKVRLEDVKFPEGKVIERIAQEINKSALKNSLLVSFEYFFNNSLGTQLKKRSLNVLKKAFFKIIPGGDLANAATDLIAQTGDFNSEMLFSSSITEIILILKSYIEHNLRNTRLIINIENIQSVDQTSLLLLRQIIENTEATLFVLEYTTDSKNRIDESLLLESLRTENTITDIQELKKLSFDDYLQILTLKGLDKKSLETILRYTYVRFDGDLRNLTDTDIILGFDQNISAILQAVKEDSFNPRQRNIQSLNDTDKFILSSVVAHNSELFIDNLLYLYKAAEVKHLLFDIDLSLSNLERQQLIIRNGSSISISHDSIADTILSNDEYLRFIFLAHKIWSEYYRELLGKNEYSKYSKEKILFHLFNSLLFYSPEGLLQILKEIKEVMANAIRADAAISYLSSLNKIMEQYPNRITEDIAYEFVEIYYFLGIFDRAYATLNSIASNSPRKIVFKAALLNRLDRYEEAVFFIEKSYSDYDSLRFKLCLDLILMVCYRSAGMMDLCENTYYEIQGNFDYASYLEYGYFLRNSEIVLPVKDSIKAAEESVLLFEKKHMDIQTGHSKITTSMLYTWTGDLVKGQAELNEAESLLIGKTLERHIIFNNKAAIYLYKGNYTTEVGDFLNEARATALSPFDKIAVYINMLIYYKRSGVIDKRENLISLLLSTLELEKDMVLHRLVYYHLAWNYSSYNHELANYYTTKANEIHERLKGDDYNIYWEHRLRKTTDTSLLSEYQKFLLSYDYEPCFVSYWHFEIPKQFD